MVATGGVFEPSVQAADILMKSGTFQDLSIVNANWIHPVSEESIDELLALEPSLIVSVEDHYNIGGLGGVLAERLSSRGVGTRLLRLGVEDFGQSGSPDDNYKFYGFTGEAIASRVRSS